MIFLHSLVTLSFPFSCGEPFKFRFSISIIFLLNLHFKYTSFFSPALFVLLSRIESKDDVRVKMIGWINFQQNLKGCVINLCCSMTSRLQFQTKFYLATNIYKFSFEQQFSYPHYSKYLKPMLIKILVYNSVKVCGQKQILIKMKRGIKVSISLFPEDFCQYYS